MEEGSDRAATLRPRRFPASKLPSSRRLSFFGLFWRRRALLVAVCACLLTGGLASTGDRDGDGSDALAAGHNQTLGYTDQQPRDITSSDYPGSQGKSPHGHSRREPAGPPRSPAQAARDGYASAPTDGPTSPLHGARPLNITGSGSTLANVTAAESSDVDEGGKDEAGSGPQAGLTPIGRRGG